jgi:hypothetical protein
MFTIFPTLTEITETEAGRRFVTEDGIIVRLCTRTNVVDVLGPTHTTTLFGNRGGVDRRPVGFVGSAPRVGNMVRRSDGGGCVEMS